MRTLEAAIDDRRIEPLMSAENRSALAGLITRLFEQWDMDATSQCRLLGLNPNSRRSLQRYRRGEPVAASEDMIDRIGHLLAIHKSLRLLYPRNRAVVHGWMTHTNEDFQPTPLEFILRHRFEGLARVRRYLDFRRGR